jgi:hypothetical protein
MDFPSTSAVQVNIVSSMEPLSGTSAGNMEMHDAEDSNAFLITQQNHAEQISQMLLQRFLMTT